MKVCLKNFLLILISLISLQIYAMQPRKPAEALPPRPTRFIRIAKKEALRLGVIRNALPMVQRNVVDLGILDDKDLERLEMAADYVKKLKLDPESDAERTRLQIFELLKREIPGFYYRPLIGSVIDPDLREIFAAAHDGLDNLAELAISDVDTEAKTLVSAASTPELSLRSLRTVDSPSSTTFDSPRRSVFSVSILELLASDPRAVSAPAVDGVTTEDTPPRVVKATRGDGASE